MKRYFEESPEYSSVVDTVWMWSEFPLRHLVSSGDTGIDLVILTRSGEYWAVQCKMYDEGHRVSKDDYDRFISTAKMVFEADGIETGFAHGIMVSTVSQETATAGRMRGRYANWLINIHLRDLEQSGVNWEALAYGASGFRRRRMTLRPYQKDALATAESYYARNKRGKMIMACGTGKTFVSLRIAESVGRNDILFLTPSISLVGQALKVWTAQHVGEMTVVCVCSDPTVVKDSDYPYGEDPGFPVTTDPGLIASSFNAGKGFRVIFATYQSIDRIITAQREHGLPRFGMVVCDEAHRTATNAQREYDRPFIRVHKEVDCRKILYMTATPRVFDDVGKERAAEKGVEVISMDDRRIFGDKFYGISFRSALDRGILSDFTVFVMGVRTGEIPEDVLRAHRRRNGEFDVDRIAKTLGIIRAFEDISEMNGTDMGSAVVFCRDTKVSKEFEAVFNAMSEVRADGRYEVRHIEGRMSAAERGSLLYWLTSGKGHVLSNARCLTEGVDVPSLDAVAFLDYRKSEVDIAQAIGRTMRASEGKRMGYIIVPMVVPDDTAPEDVERIMRGSRQWDKVLEIMEIMKSYDADIVANVTTITGAKSSTSPPPWDSTGNGGPVTVHYPWDVFAMHVDLAKGRDTFSDMRNGLMVSTETDHDPETLFPEPHSNWIINIYSTRRGINAVATNYALPESERVKVIPKNWYKPRPFKKGTTEFPQGTDAYVCKNAVKREFLNHLSERYGKSVTNDQVFYYNYAYLWSRQRPDTKASKGATDVSYPDDRETFERMMRIGKELVKLHIGASTNYHVVDTDVINHDRLEWMCKDPKRCGFRSITADRKAGTIHYNRYLTFTDVPRGALEFRIGNKTGFEWFLDMYLLNQDADSREEMRVMRLLDFVSIVATCIRTSELLDSMPRLDGKG